MKCPKCGNEISTGVKFCSHCGTNMDVIEPDLPVHSFDAWKKSKDDKKNEALLKSRQEAKEHMDQIKRRMYQQQANFSVDEMFEEVKKKDKKDKCQSDEMDE